MLNVRPWRRAVVLAIAIAASAGAARAQDCAINGPSLICPNSTVDLCAIGSEWQWTGPNGFTATSQCITVAAPGTYSVRVFDALNGLWFGPCSWTVSAAPAESCSVDPPPPPPREGGTTTCPRPPSFWARQCRGHRHGTSLSPSALASLAASVDARSAVFNWQNPSRGFAATLNPGDDDGLRERTLRQYASVLANLCARDAGLAVGGTFIGVGGDATFQAGAGQLAVEDWVAAAEVQLLSLRGQRGRERSARTVMRRLFSDAWAINHGVGMATTCAPPRERDADDQSAGAAMGDGDIGLNLASPPAGAGARASLTSPRLMKYQ